MRRLRKWRGGSGINYSPTLLKPKQKQQQSLETQALLPHLELKMSQCTTSIQKPLRKAHIEKSRMLPS